MEVKEFSYVLLKDGRDGLAIHICEPNKVFYVDFGSDEETSDSDLVNIDDIAMVLD